MLDFPSTHTYGSPPLDLRAWTEWGVSPRHFAEVNDSVFGAPFILGDTWGRDE